MNTSYIGNEVYINPNQMSYEEYLEDENNFPGDYFADPLEILISEEEQQ